jgi:protoporphyrinogen oxidase
MNDQPVIIIGAGPAGLSSAYELLKKGVKPLVLEKSDRVGGMARTETFKGNHFDIGGHRFFSKNKEINRLWEVMLGGDLLRVKRRSRIYYQAKLFNYPISPLNVLSNLGFYESFLVLLSYLKSMARPGALEDTFEQWVSNRFGKRLYEIFFRTYTEKVWGIPCNAIMADWAAQRIKGLSLMQAMRNALTGATDSCSLISEFSYPVNGSGMVWHRFQEEIEKGGGTVALHSRAKRLKHDHTRITHIHFDRQGQDEQRPVRQLISSIPLPRLMSMLDPAPPEQVLRAADRLRFRAFVLVILMVKKSESPPDQWIYVHDRNVRVGRIQYVHNWSAAMVAESGNDLIGMEYFCNQGDRFWETEDARRVATAADELAELGLVNRNDVHDGTVVRQPYAYPIYDQGYAERVTTIRKYLEGFANLQTIGRNGLHRYNNMDHSMLTGVLAARNVLGAGYDVWTVNEAREYMEEESGAKDRQPYADKHMPAAFSRIDGKALGSALAAVFGILFFLITAWPALTRNAVLRPYLALLSQYYFGYTVSIQGAFIASGYSLLWGFFFGWIFARLRNFIVARYIQKVRRKAERALLNRYQV